ncbi:hypothetical protein [Mesobacillus sp. S13]|uniref:hypothetical protein n=1 Tax=Mesobacillus sp. S13 TaxID=2880221 RepID=UPI001CF435A2|nr:hypothetical protein [Mesobacillus sp. S13]
MDVKLISVLISGSVALFIAVLNHFIITPYKERKNRKREQLKHLYAPLYGIINVRVKLVIEMSMRAKKLMLGNVDNKEYQSGVFMEKFIIEKSGYCSDELLEAWIEYSSQFGEFKKETTERLVVAVVKEYNQLKKDLNLPYNKEELKTGIPESIKQYREILIKHS